jgi:hypothetical protein
MTRHDHHRTPRHAKHLFSDRAKQQSPDTGAAVTAITINSACVASACATIS